MNAHQIINAVLGTGVTELHAIRAALNDPGTIAGLESATPEAIQNASELLQDASIEINVKHLKAASRIAAKNDIRYYLTGVYVEATPSQTILAATDGHAMIILRHEAENKITGTARLIMPKHIVAMLTKGSLRMLPKTTDIQRVGAFKWSANLPESMDTAISFREIEGNFPKWRRVVPDEISGQAAQFNPALIYRVKQAFDDVFGAKLTDFHLRQNGQKGSIAQHGSDCSFLAVIMPMHSGTLEPKTPEWAK